MSGVCLLRVAVLTAVMIWRVMHSSAKLRNERLAVRAEVADRLVEPDQALLDEVVGVAADQEVRRRLQAHERVVAPHQTVVRVRVPLLREGDQIAIINLKLTLRLLGDPCHNTPLHGPRRARIVVAHSSPGAYEPRSSALTLDFSVMIGER